MTSTSANNELQSYLESFNKEIEIVEDIVDSNEVESDEEEEGTYFVDQSGNYYSLRSKSSEPALTDPLAEDEDEKIINNELEVLEEHTTEEYLEDEDLLTEMKTTRNPKGNTRETKKSLVSRITKNTEDEEVSYLLIMDDNSKKDDDDEDEKPNEEIYELQEAKVSTRRTVQKDNNENKKKARVVSKKNKNNTSESVHLCGYCDYVGSKRYLLARHLKSHSEERPYKCSICERGFKTQASLQNHVNTHTGIKPHQCTYCFSSFTTSGELVRHVRYKHTHEKPHKCSECDYASVELSKLKRHIRCHTGERPYQCPHCTYASPDTFKLKRHMRIHTGEKPYECDICHARFTQSNSLKAHKLIHSVGDKPVFQCELCPTTCGRKTDLRIHVQKLHTSDQPLKCRRCDQLFPDRYSYKVHSKTHEGEKCFKCELCPYASISARHLESHMLIHTDQKPYECPYCEQSFRQKQLLKRHINLYHNKDYTPPTPKPKTHVCPDCDRSFSHKGNLIRHMAVHDPESAVKEKAIALKVGRQMKVQTANDGTVDVKNMDTTDEEQEYITHDHLGTVDDLIEEIENTEMSIKEENDEVVTLQTSDDGAGQYVVLEVVQVDGETTTAHISEISGNAEDNPLTDDGYIFSDLNSEVPEKTFKEEILEGDNSKDNSEMEVCFGFDEN